MRLSERQGPDCSPCGCQASGPGKPQTGSTCGRDGFNLPPSAAEAQCPFQFGSLASRDRFSRCTSLNTSSRAAPAMQVEEAETGSDGETPRHRHWSQSSATALEVFSSDGSIASAAVRSGSCQPLRDLPFLPVVPEEFNDLENG